MTEKPEIRLVLAGHVDHGKSTLIGRLLLDTGNLPQEAIDGLRAIRADARAGGDDCRLAHVMDHLAEERGRSLTMDTAQAVLRIGRRHYVLIDAPGHRQFVRNMVTGASQAHTAMLVVAANEGLREQTRRHCNLLAMLGIRQIIVAVNKMDKVLFSRRIFDHIAGNISGHLGRLGLAARAVVPISSQRGTNILTAAPEMEWHSGPTLIEAMAGLAAPDGHGAVPAMPVQDVYRDAGGAEVLAGRVDSGGFAVGDSVRLCPDGPAGVIREIRTFRGATGGATAGECVTVKLDQDSCGGGVSCGEGVQSSEGVSPSISESHEETTASEGKMPSARAGETPAPLPAPLPAPRPARRGQVMMRTDAPLPSCRSARGRIFWMSRRPLAQNAELELRCATQSAGCRVAEIRSRIDSETLMPVEPHTEVAFTEIAEVMLSFDRPVVLAPFDKLPELGRFTLCRGDEVCAGGILEFEGPGFLTETNNLNHKGH